MISYPDDFDVQSCTPTLSTNEKQVGMELHDSEEGSNVDSGP